MFDGICPKCHQTEVRERNTQLAFADQHEGALHVRLFVCLACGYTEAYTHDEHLQAIAQSADWRPVRPAYQSSAHAPVTGVTVRLTPPDEQPAQSSAGQPSSSLKKRCPSCQSDKLIPAVRVIDRNQSFPQNLTVEVDSKPKALVFRGTIPSDLRAWVCSHCGYTSLFADRPEDLYNAYQAGKR